MSLNEVANALRDAAEALDETAAEIRTNGSGGSGSPFRERAGTAFVAVEVEGVSRDQVLRVLRDTARQNGVSARFFDVRGLQI